MRTTSSGKMPQVSGAILLFVLALGARAHAGLISYDGFDYSSTALNGQNGGTGWNGGWFNTASTDNVLSNDGVSLSYPVPFEAPLTTPVSIGSHVKTGGVGANSSRLLSQTIPLNVDGTTAFVSALIRKNRPNGEVNNDNILLEFADSAGNRRWGMGIEGTTDKPWLNANGSTTPSGGPAVTVGDTYFLVAKIVSSAVGMDTAYLKVFGTGYSSLVPFDEPTTWDATQTQTTGAILDRIRLRIDAGNTSALPGEVDDIRIGTTWGDVVGVPEPSTMALLCAGGFVAIALRKRDK